MKTGAHKKFKHVKMDKSKLKCYNYDNKDHFPHECIKSKQVWSYSNNTHVLMLLGLSPREHDMM